MAPMERAVLELFADPVGTGADWFKFEFVGNLEIQEGITPQFTLASGEGAALTPVVRSGQNLNPFNGVASRKRRGFYLDLGAGMHVVEFNFNGWHGARRPILDSNGNITGFEDVDWGDGSGSLPTDASGADPMTQVHLFLQCLSTGEFDSRSADAQLRFGEYTGGSSNVDGEDYPDGEFADWLQVTFRDTQFSRVANDPLRYNGSVIMTEVLNYDDPIDAPLKGAR